ncbi:MAG: vWA domain-containing protein [Methanothrix sp.]
MDYNLIIGIIIIAIIISFSYGYYLKESDNTIKIEPNKIITSNGKLKKEISDCLAMINYELAQQSVGRGDYEAAERQCTQALNTAPNGKLKNEIGDCLAMINYELAQQSVGKGDLEAAERQCTQASKTAPNGKLKNEIDECLAEIHEAAKMRSQLEKLKMDENKKYSILLMIDVSESMRTILDPHKSVLIEYLKKEKRLSKSSFGLILFGGNVIWSEYKKNGKDLYSAIQNIHSDSGGTNMYDAFVCAKKNLSKGNNGIILLSDGEPTGSNGHTTANEKDRIIKYVNKEIIPILKLKNGFGIEYIALGDNINYEFLNRLENLVNE